MFLRCNLATLVALALVGVSQSLEASKIGLIIGPDRLTSENDKNLINELDDAEFGSAPLTAENGQTWRNEYHQSSCQLVQIVHLLRHTGCQSKAIASFACSGLCLSYVKTSPSKFWQHERYCSCCQETGSQEATFTLDCPSLDPPFRKVKTHAPVDCLCRSCTDLGREDLRPQELVEALANEAPISASGLTNHK